VSTPSRFLAIASPGQSSYTVCVGGMNVNFNQFDDNQFTISPELLTVMARIVDDHPQELQALIQKAQRSLGAGHKTLDEDYAHDSIIDFLSLMELFAYQAKNEVEVDTHLAKQMMPAIDHIDGIACDHETVASSVEHASEQKNKHPHINAQELLYKELLRRWKPAKKTSMN